MRHLRRLILPILLLALAAPAGSQVTPGGPPPEQVVIPQAPKGTPTFGQVTVGSTATQIRASSATRLAVCVVQHGTTDVFLGFNGAVTTTTGTLLAGTKGTERCFVTTSALFGIVASGSQVVSFHEEIR